MICIYDFDGTLTPYFKPQYEILEKLGYSGEKMSNYVIEKALEEKISFYEAYYNCYRDLFELNNIKMSKENVCLGAENVKFNDGVIDFLKRYQSVKTGIKHYVVTAGIQDYVESTYINSYVDGIYGVRFIMENDEYKEVEFLLDDKKKVDTIKKIRDENGLGKNIIYFGDGLTDQNAFEYVHSIGGTTIFIKYSDESNVQIYDKFNEMGIISKCFDANYCENSELDNYMKEMIKNSSENIA